MKTYVGCKLVKAEPREVDGKPGYKVIYGDGYESWSPKEVFEKYYFSVGEENSVKEVDVDAFIVDYDISQWGDKTTHVFATLANGFIIGESSSCVDPENFNMDIGESICKEKIQSKVWQFLGFMLQCALKGVKGQGGRNE